MIRSFFAAVFVLTALATAGCVRATHQLSEVGKVVTDDEIVGVWEFQDPVFGADKDHRLKVEALENDCYRYTCTEGASTESVDFRLVEAAGATYFEVIGCSRDGQSDKEKTSQMSFPARWERRGDWVAVDAVNVKAIDRLVRKKTLAGKSEPGFWFPKVIVTASAKDLETFLTKHGDSVFAERAIYRKVNSAPTELETATDRESQ